MIKKYLPTDIFDLYEVHNYRHALEVLSTGCSDEFNEIVDALRKFKLTHRDLTARGGKRINDSKENVITFTTYGMV